LVLADGITEADIDAAEELLAYLPEDAAEAEDLAALIDDARLLLPQEVLIP
jgi:hypothetical protein